MIEIKVNKSIVSVQETEPLYSGASGVHKCHFTFDGSWNAFGKSAVFRVGAKTITVWIDSDGYCDLPWELLTRANIGHVVEVGVYGVSKDEEVLTSVWDSIGKVRDGAELGTDAKNPTPNIYEQVIASVQSVSDAVDRYESTVEGYLQRAESSAASAADSSAKTLANLSSAKVAASTAERYFSETLVAAERAETARDEAVPASHNAVNASALAKTFADNAKTSEDAAKTSETNAASSATDAEKFAARAQAEAERVSVPAAVGVYNVILTDRITGEKYAMLVDAGRLYLLGVSADLNSSEVNLVDNATGTAYIVAVDDGRIILEEV